MAQSDDPRALRDPRYAVLHALPDEIRYFRGLEHLRIGREGMDARVESRRGDASQGAIHGCSVCIGVGVGNAFQNTSLLLQSVPSLRALIVIGFAGALSDSVGAGDVVVGESVTNLASRQSYEAPSGLLAAMDAHARAQKSHRGRIVTADRVIVTAAEKQQLGRATGALAVDMESAGVAAAAAEHGVPWIAVRVISDGVNDDLPLDFNALANADGSVNTRRIIASVLLRPAKIPALIRLGMRTSAAARNLAAFLQPLLQRLPE